MGSSNNVQQPITVEELLSLAASVVDSRKNFSTVTDRILVGLHIYLGKNQRFNHNITYNSRTSNFSISTVTLEKFGVTLTDTSSTSITYHATDLKVAPKIFDVEDILFLRTENSLMSCVSEASSLANVTKVCILFDVEKETELNSILLNLRNLLNKNVSLLYSLRLSVFDVYNTEKNDLVITQANETVLFDEVEAIASVVSNIIANGIRHSMKYNEMATEVLKVVSIDSLKKYVAVNKGKLSKYQELVLHVLCNKYSLKVTHYPTLPCYSLFAKERWYRQVEFSYDRWLQLEKLSEFQLSTFAGSQLPYGAVIFYHLPLQSRSVGARLRFADNRMEYVQSSKMVTKVTVDDKEELFRLSDSLGKICHVSNTVKFQGRVGLIAELVVNFKGKACMPSLFSSHDVLSASDLVITNVSDLYSLMPIGSFHFIHNNILSDIVAFMRLCLPSAISSKVTEKSVSKLLGRFAATEHVPSISQLESSLCLDLTDIVYSERDGAVMRSMNDGSEVFGIFNVLSLSGQEKVSTMLEYMDMQALYSVGYASTVGCVPPFPFTRWTRFYREGVYDVSLGDSIRC